MASVCVQSGGSLRRRGPKPADLLLLQLPWLPCCQRLHQWKYLHHHLQPPRASFSCDFSSSFSLHRPLIESTTTVTTHAQRAVSVARHGSPRCGHVSDSPVSQVGIFVRTIHAFRIVQHAGPAGYIGTFVNLAYAVLRTSV